MRKHVGLAMTMNEQDIAQESMVVHTRYFDEIVVMDNSTDDTPDILYQFPQVKKIFRERHIWPGGRPFWEWDGLRQILIKFVEEELGGADWYTLIHLDEIWHDDPIKATELAERENAECVWWKVAQFYFHESERETALEEDVTLPVQKRRLWYSINWTEIRQFKNKPGIRYPLRMHGRAQPDNINPNNRLAATPLYKHYSFRSLDQARVRIAERSKIQPWYLKSEGDNLFKTHCPHGIKLKKFDGSFGIYENSLEAPEKRGTGWNYFTQKDFAREMVQQVGVV